MNNSKCLLAKPLILIISFNSFYDNILQKIDNLMF